MGRRDLNFTGISIMRALARVMGCIFLTFSRHGFANGVPRCAACLQLRVVNRGIVMAFLQFATLAGDGGMIGTIQSVQNGFTPVEWQVIQLARRDGTASLRAPDRWDRLKTWIFGERANPRLANGRLESLRRLAVDAWHRGYAVRPSFLKAFLKAGFNESQLETLLAAISANRRV
jgi:hypothetical protein